MLIAPSRDGELLQLPDAYEWLIVLLDWMHAQLQRGDGRSGLQPWLPKVGAALALPHVTARQCPRGCVVGSQRGEFVDKVVCPRPECARESETRILSYLVAVVAVHVAGVRTVLEGLRRGFAPERLDEYKCPHCGEHVRRAHVASLFCLSRTRIRVCCVSVFVCSCAWCVCSVSECACVRAPR